MNRSLAGRLYGIRNAIPALILAASAAGWSGGDRWKRTMAAKPKSVTFDTAVAASGNNTGIVVPEEVIEQLAAGKRPPVLVNVNGYEYRNTIGVMGGKHMISISAAVRNATGLKGGDPIRVTLTVADTPREVTVPGDFAAALAADEQASAFFGKLSNSMQRFHVENITAAKSADTRQRRIDKAIALFRADKQR
jgi:Bacteriocin-protection, YdeI or OmpD-Associated/Domain of unknown function (DUF1905)